MLANAWHVGSFRLFALAILHSRGARITAAALPSAGIQPTYLVSLSPLSDRTPAEILIGLCGRRFVDTYIRLLPQEIQAVVLPFASVFDAPDIAINGFTKFRETFGLRTRGLWHPELAEADSAGVLRASAGLQPGFLLRKGAMERLVEPQRRPTTAPTQGAGGVTTPVRLSRPTGPQRKVRH